MTRLSYGEKHWIRQVISVHYVDQFGVLGIQIVGTTIYLNILVKDLAGIPRYFHLDHVEIPLSPTTLEQATSHPP
ncbi:11100_t:CDS:2 [Funneliformis geosporum]|uniref:11100_t:CDS:1 n=1 Tax=Funneliformis geosporum TaxID=1117311 RepID=A0A9W4T462_9GLOM|nr:11100_t:CDS:2 [Funneliformis geosporum]